VTTFVLVHGAWHGAWCWEQLIPQLTRRGHEVIAPDLPCDDPSASFEDYADVVCAALAAQHGTERDDVVIVGHSLAGHTIPLVATRRPVRRLIYLCAMVPEIGRSLRDQLRDGTEMNNPLSRQALSRPDEQRRNTWIDEALTTELLFTDVDPGQAHAAFGRLRPQALFPYSQTFSLEQLPEVARTSVVCDGDRIVGPDWSRKVARDLLDADLVELPGGHSPFLSRPAQLAELLHGLSG
jgi:pimeloyl-ACP methyl ester carboxylesterase